MAGVILMLLVIYTYKVRVFTMHHLHSLIEIKTLQEM